MKKLIFTIFFSIAANAYPQSEFQKFLDSVNSAQTDSEKTALIDSFMAQARTVGIPYIEDSTAHFIYRGAVNSVDRLTLGFGDVSMQRLSNTDFFYTSQSLELDARMDYIYQLNNNNDSLIIDPENPNVTHFVGPNIANFPGGPASELAMPNYVQPWEVKFNPLIAHGTVVSHDIHSAQLDSTYFVQVYLPPGYDSSSRTYPSLYVNDGQVYADTAFGMINVLDNLIEQSTIDEIITVFISSFAESRTPTYAGALAQEYEDFVVNTVVSFVDSVYRTDQSPKSRGIMGFSFGGLISTQIAYNNSEVFGLCGLHSPSYWPNFLAVLTSVTTGPVKDIKFYIDWGTYEEAIALLARRFRDLMIPKGYEIRWNEWHEGHARGSWRAHTDNALEFLYPTEPTSVASSQDRIVVNEFQLSQNYPNPFNPSTTIRYAIPTPSAVTLKVFNLVGQEITTLVSEKQAAGKHQIEWQPTNLASGVYVYRLQAGRFVQSRKLILLK